MDALLGWLFMIFLVGGSALISVNDFINDRREKKLNK